MAPRVAQLSSDGHRLFQGLEAVEPLTDPAAEPGGTRLGGERVEQTFATHNFRATNRITLVAVSPRRDGRDDGEDQCHGGGEHAGRGQQSVAPAPPPCLLDWRDPPRRTGRSSRNRLKSSPMAPAVAYRSPGSLAIALSTIVSRSRGILESSFLGDSGGA